MRLCSIRRGDARDQHGQGLAEYALILALIGVAAVIALTFMGTSINSMLSTLNNVL